MLVIPTRAAEHRHIPTPWAIGPWLFTLKCGQINRYPEASSCLPWSAALLRNPYLVWMLQLHSLCLSKLSSSKKGEPPEVSLGTLWALCYLCLLQLWLPHLVNTPSIGSVVHIIISFWLPIWGSLKASHPLFNAIDCSWSFGGLCLSPWSPWPSGLHVLLYHRPNNGMATFLHGFPQRFYLCGSPSLIKWAS